MTTNQRDVPLATTAAQARTPLPCPAEQLSCGLQEPVVSDGVQPFENAEMGLKAVFPRGSRVCIGRSGDAPRGFYAWYGTDVTGCPERGDVPATFMAVGSMFNAPFYNSLRAAAPNCRPISEDVRQRLHGTNLSFAGHTSLACEERRPDGTIEIMVHALAGTRPDDGPRDVPPVIYYALLGSRTDRLDEDLTRFRTFLGRVRIGTLS